MSGALADLVGDVDEFVATYWSQRPMLRRGVPEELWSDLLTLEDVDRMLAAPRSELHLLGPETWLDRDDYTHRVAAAPMRPAGLLAEPSRVYGHLDDGATAVLLGLHEAWPPLERLCVDMAHTLTMPVQANLYVAPPNRPGVRHHDLHDIIVLQLHGTKAWTVWAAPLGSENGDGDLRATLSPGDCIYVPRRCAHAVDTAEELSVHVTFGIAGPAWGEAISRALVGALPPHLVDAPLPAAFAAGGRGELQATSAAVLQQVRATLDGLDADRLADIVATELWQPPEPSWDGHLLRLAALRGLGPGSRLRLRSDVTVEMHCCDETLWLELPDRDLEMPAALAAAVTIILEGGVFTPAGLASELDRDSALVLVRRLVREGVLDVLS